MAVVGYEADQVMDTEEGERSVPITWAYNHHYVSYLTGKLSELRQLDSQVDWCYDSKLNNNEC